MNAQNLFFSLNESSSDKKTGRIAVSYTGAQSCPKACPLKERGCYALNYGTNFHWFAVTNGVKGRSTKQPLRFNEFMKAVSKLPRNTLFRHNIAGDLPHNDQKIDSDFVSEFIKATKGKRAFLYTHHSPLFEENKREIKRLNAEKHVVCNLSANNVRHADQLVKMDLGPVATVLPSDFDRNKTRFTPAGNKIIQCPATYNKSITCEKCQLCAKKRSVIVGFPAHGTKMKDAETLSQGYVMA